jgi:hypothetical protein
MLKGYPRWNTLFRVTFTGVDANTNLTAIAYNIMRPRVEVEWGFLYSPSKAGKENRYMTWSDILLAAKEIKRISHNVPLALHLCGSSVMSYLNGLLVVGDLFDRIQLNFNHKKGNVDTGVLSMVLNGNINGKHAIILQYNKSNHDLVHLFGQERDVHFLMDQSGGRGIDRPVTDLSLFNGSVGFALFNGSVGFAGGLGPDNIKEKMKEYRQIAQGPFWIDMETKVRTDDWLDLDKCRRVLDQL